MKNIRRSLTTALRFAFAAALLCAAAQWTTVSAQNPGAVFVEGNCDEVEVEALVGGGYCKGDWDGDGNSGVDEDTDGDSTYGTIQGALEAIDHNGKVVIVASGRFYENVYIGQQQGLENPFGALVPGNVTLEAAPGVEAVIDAFAQTGSAVAGNNTRAGGTGVAVNYTTNGATRVVTLRNLEVRNFNLGITADNNTRIHIDNVRVENNQSFGIRLSNNARGVISRAHVTGTGFRVSTAGGGGEGTGIFINQTSQARIIDTIISHSAGFGLRTAATASTFVVRVNTHFNNGGNTLGTNAPCDPALCSN